LKGISDGQISNHFSVPKHKSLDKKIYIFMPNVKLNLKSEIILAQISHQIKHFIFIAHYYN